MGRPVLRIVLLLVASGVSVAIVAVAPNLIHNRLVFGTIATDGAPLRVDYCGRRYYPAEAPTAKTLAQVDAFLAQNRVHGLTAIDAAPSRMPVLANVMTLPEKARYHTDVCAMTLWVKTGSDAYVAYSLTGGP